MLTNKVADKLRNGGVVIGCQVRSRSPMIAELYGYCGFDYVFIEGEHFPYDIESVLSVVHGCDCAGIVPILRIPDSDPAKILQSLDMGVKGMLFPHVDTAEQAAKIMDAGKYAPIGHRGFSNTSRATEYGGIPMESYKMQANANTLMIPFIESRQAVENIEAILDAGVDAVHLGPGDLSESYGEPISGAAVQQAIDIVIRAANARSIPVGIPAATPEAAAAAIKRGCRMISFSSDLALLRESCGKALVEIKAKIISTENEVN